MSDIKKSPLYTKRGDKGETDLVDGTRLSKSSQRIDIYGDLDELNSYIGWCLSYGNKEFFTIEPIIEHLHFLLHVQHELFVLESHIACLPENLPKCNLPSLNSSLVNDMEGKLDLSDSLNSKMTSFIIPGGHELASRFHITRTFCRRIERKMVGFMQTEGENSLPKEALPLINRLSDYLFSLARLSNQLSQTEEIKWVPSKN